MDMIIALNEINVSNPGVDQLLKDHPVKLGVCSSRSLSIRLEPCFSSLYHIDVNLLNISSNKSPSPDIDPRSKFCPLSVILSMELPSMQTLMSMIPNRL